MRLTPAAASWGRLAVKGHGTQFGRKKEAAVVALLTQRNIEEAARAVGISQNTLLNWLKVPEFQTAYREARRAAFLQSIARLQQGATAAATTMLKLMIESTLPPQAKAKAREKRAQLGPCRRGD